MTLLWMKRTLRITLSLRPNDICSSNKKKGKPMPEATFAGYHVRPSVLSLIGALILNLVIWV